MKKLVFQICFLLTFSLNAQYTSIPDANFEQKLINLGYDNTLNGQVLTSIINQLTVLDLSNSNISSLTGIQDFSALTTLYCRNNPLGAVNFSQNTSLSTLQVGGATFTGLGNFNLSQNQQLFNLGIYDLQTTQLNLNLANTFIKNVNLGKVNCNLLTIGNSTNFQRLNSYNYAVNELIINNLTIQGSPNLQEIEICSFVDSGNSLTNITIDNNSAASVQIIRTMNLGLASISQNFSEFSNLRYFYADRNLLNSIDLSTNSNIIAVGVQNSTLLSELKICSSNVDSVNASNCPNLQCMSIKGTLPLIDDYFSIDAINVPNLNCLEVQDGDYFSILFPSNWPSNRINLDSQISYNTNCGNSCSVSCVTAEIPEYEIEKVLVKILDNLGRETAPKPNEILIYYFSDGSVQKKLFFE